MFLSDGSAISVKRDPKNRLSLDGTVVAEIIMFIFYLFM